MHRLVKEIVEYGRGGQGEEPKKLGTVTITDARVTEIGSSGIKRTLTRNYRVNIGLHEDLAPLVRHFERKGYDVNGSWGRYTVSDANRRKVIYISKADPWHVLVEGEFKPHDETALVRALSRRAKR